MEYRNLGRSGLKVSLHTLGTMNFAAEGFFSLTGTASPADAARLVDLAVDRGVNMLDTSNAYSLGKSEKTLGQILKGRSPQLMVTTKVRFAVGDGPNQEGLSRAHIIGQCEASLSRLGRDHIDLYLLHQWDGSTPVEETMEALDTLVRQGKVRYVGCSNFSAWHIMKYLMASDQKHLQRFVCQQVHYSVEAREVEFELMPLALDQGVGLQVWSPLAGGLLSGKFRRDRPDPKVSRHLDGWGEPPIRNRDRLFDIVEVLCAIGEARGVSPAQIALAWLQQRPAVCSIVIGARNEAQLADNLDAMGLTLSAQEMQELDAVSLLPQPYPYWHQSATGAGRLGDADLAMHAPYLARRRAGAS